MSTQPNDPRNFWTVDYGLDTFGKLFTERQLVSLNTFSDLVHEARKQIEIDALATLPADGTLLRDNGRGAKAYAEAVSVYLATLIRCVRSSIAQMVAGPFAYAETYDEAQSEYRGLSIESAGSAAVTIDADSVIVRPTVAEAARAKQVPAQAERTTSPSVTSSGAPVSPTTADGEREGGTTAPVGPAPEAPKDPTRFQGTVMISADRPARDMAQIVEAIVEQLTTVPGAEVTLRLEIDAEVPSGLDRSKIRTLTENASTLGFIDKVIS